MSKPCQVKGCETPAETVLDFNGLPGREHEGRVPLQGFVCRFHENALSAGAPFLTDRDEHALLMGEDVPPVLAGVTFRDGLGNPTMTLTFARDGVVVQEIDVLISQEFFDEHFLNVEEEDSWLREIRRNRIEQGRGRSVFEARHSLHRIEILPCFRRSADMFVT